ncbi:uncharacterized protein LOC127278181 [Leptopilina boulardi]|uniref:uncharacterized protein LOC127278181 n=1 Tax=Leptopilina boulardi TaxID=63433 RepID=UPI0021F65AAC|nr:uncharacterized protein LOC127278181 [Leptopilina boulardi]
MNYLRGNQKQLRADTYESLLEHLEKTVDNTSRRVGKVVVLPSTYQGSPRNMQQNYQDAMTIVRQFGKPDTFTTMTCNPKWREITENLLDGQTASDRPDFVARVFELKKEEFINIIVKEKLFGEVQAYVYVVEYQKRGLPHIHLLIKKPNSKITTPEIVDKIISAEIPDPAENPRLHEIVVANMIHGPCGDWCLDKDGKCSKNYPKQFNDQTNKVEDGYPNYRRRNTVTYTRRDGFQFDNRHVVPHNKELLLRLNCYINVEVVTSIKAVKYLYKYIYKGHDAAAVVIQEAQSNENQEVNVLEHDEIKHYVESRYVSPPEVCGRILSNNLQGKSHTIYRLPVHLQNQQTVIVDNVDDPNTVRSALNRSTELTEYFALNNRDPHAKNYTYSEIPLHYVFQKKGSSNANTWQKRKKHFNTLGRMYSVSPSQPELYHLRLLLITVKGATSYEHLRTVDGVVHDSFVFTCLKLGLIEDDDEWENAMHEAEVWMMPRQLRQLFVRILVHCQPVHPEELWEKFKDALSEDYSRTMSADLAQKKVYIHINTLLTAENSSLTSFPSMPQVTETEDDIENEILLEQHQTIGSAQYRKLNEKQKEIVDVVLKTVHEEQSVANNKSRCFFIDGPGGSGKTFVYTTLYHLLQSEKKKVCTMAFTGIAATLLPHVGNGTANHDENDLKLPEECIAPPGTDIAEDTYGNVIRNKEFDKLTKMAILSARNVDVDDINRSVVELLNVATEKIYTSINTR